MKALDTALTRNDASIHPINVREAMIGMVKEADLPDDTKKQYLEFLQDTLHKVYLDLLEKDITRPSSTASRTRPRRCSTTTSTTPRPTSPRRS
jgi:predicted Ser/Thr protein kinase